ncbi:hypothetical protein HK098_006132, partial [Nowakowskiella sp. JEL0407]
MDKEIESVYYWLDILYGPKSTAENIAEADKYLRKLHSSPNSINIAWYLLQNSPKKEIAFFAARLLLTAQSHSKILSTDTEKEILHDQLIVLLHSYTTNYEYFKPAISLLLQSLIKLIIQLRKDPFTLQIFENQLLKIEYLKLLPQELQSNYPTPENLTNVFQFLESFIDPITPLTLPALESYEPWLNYLTNFDQIAPIFPKFLTLLQIESTFDASTNIISTLISKIKITQSLFFSFLQIFTTGFIYDTLRECFFNGEQEFSRKISLMFVEFGEVSCGLLVQFAGVEQVRKFLEICVELTGFPGMFGVDQFISDIFCEFWEEIQLIVSETSIDLGGNDLVTDPISGRPVFLGDGSDKAIVGGSVVPKVESVEARNAVVEVYKKLVVVLLAKLAKMENCIESDNSMWSADERDRHLNLRRQYADVLQSSYSILKKELIFYYASVVEESQRVVVSQVAEGKDDYHVEWQKLESCLFCLKSISESLPKVYDVEMHKMFEIFLQVGGIEGRLVDLKLMILRVFESYSEHFSIPEYHPLLLPLSKFIFSSMTFKSVKMRGYAVDAFASLVEVCKVEFAQGAGMLFEMYDAVKDGLE